MRGHWMCACRSTYVALQAIRAGSTLKVGCRQRKTAEDESPSRKNDRVHRLSKKNHDSASDKSNYSDRCQPQINHGLNGSFESRIVIIFDGKASKMRLKYGSRPDLPRFVMVYAVNC